MLRFLKLQRTLDKGFQDEGVFSCKEDLKTIQRGNVSDAFQRTHE
ncbi:unnamed protein product [Arabidopsis thaliana]|uniref:(thale cress) hypothetical protein n=1 Tax=Arabidopsis thaliana TaxID=3702 RepID=A0A7G2DZB1_ARATH|nr:unnamed protein product [Arabidopsis thaliana]